MDVLAGVEQRLEENLYEPERNFGITYSGYPAPIAKKAEALSEGRFFVEWAAETEVGTVSLEREAVGMLADLLGKPDASGFITTGGTESNLAAVRLARDLNRGVAEPEIIGPVTMHFSFRLAAELMGVHLVEVDVRTDTYAPDIKNIERSITPRTIGLVASAPAGLFGTMDPVEEIAALAQRKGLYMHVDAAFGGFILPFMKDLGYAVPAFDLSLAGVSSISTDGHKLGLLPIATGFFIARERTMWESIPTEHTLIHTISSTKPGARAAGAWATMQHLGREGYQASTRHVLELRDRIADGVSEIRGMRLAAPRFISVIGFASDSIDMEAIHRRLEEDGWGHSYGVLRGMKFIRLSVHPSRSIEAAEGFVESFRKGAAEA